jgi:hypothetical protein
MSKYTLSRCQHHRWCPVEWASCHLKYWWVITIYNNTNKFSKYSLGLFILINYCMNKTNRPIYFLTCCKLFSGDIVWYNINEKSYSVLIRICCCDLISIFLFFSTISGCFSGQWRWRYICVVFNWQIGHSFFLTGTFTCGPKTLDSMQMYQMEFCKFRWIIWLV